MFAETFKDLPAIQKPNSFTIDDAIAKMNEPNGAGEADPALAGARRR